MKLKYKYDIGDVITLNNTFFGKVGIILKKPDYYGRRPSTRYTILVCGYLEPVNFWEHEIEGKIE